MNKLIFATAWGIVVSLLVHAEQLILDDNEPSVSSAGSWTESPQETGFFGERFHISATPSSGASWTWQTQLGPDTDYQVWVGLPAVQTNQSTTATYNIVHADGTSTYVIDQTATQGWVFLGVHRFTSGSLAKVMLGNPDGNGYLVADAVRFKKNNGFEVILDDASESPSAMGVWTPSSYSPNYTGVGYRHASAGDPSVSWTWSSSVAFPSNLFLFVGLPDGSPDRAPGATYTVTDADGTRTYTVDQRGDGKWVYLGAHRWTSSAPAIITLTNNEDGRGSYLNADAVRIDTQGPVVENSFQVLPDQEHQTIRGLGVEIQFDSIGGPSGLPEDNQSVPHDLVESERVRWYSEMLSGFRECRLAMGLYLRGTDAAEEQIVGRWPSQMEEISETIAKSGMEGVAMEYWSPTPAWKSNGDYVGGSIISTSPTVLDAFGNALVNDIHYLQTNGIPISSWGLQNEPDVGEANYSCCEYTSDQYRDTFRVVAPKIRSAIPHALIHADSEYGADGWYGKKLRADSASMPYVDAWTYHRIGIDSNEQITRDFNTNAVGRPVFNNEFEYFDSISTKWRMVNTAQSVMNWFAFQDSPTWFWLHALKRINTGEANGFSLGYWRPPGYTDTSTFPDLAEGHWTWNPYNWNGLSGFIRYLPWDSVRVQVNEDSVMGDHRILAWKTPDNRLAIALSNRSTADFTYNVDFGRNAIFEGSRFTLENDNLPVGSFSGSTNVFVLPPYSVEFWVESTPYYQWSKGYWPLRPAGQDTKRAADPDGDGNSNFAEYAFGGDPLFLDMPEPMQLLKETSGETYLLKFHRRTNDTGMEYIPKISGDLFDWFSGSTYFEYVGTVPDTAEWEWVTYRSVSMPPASDGITNPYFIVTATDTNIDESVSSGVVSRQISLDNIALGKPVEVDSVHGSYAGSNAVDGDKGADTSRWISANTAWPHWIEIDFQEEYSITGLKFWTGYAGYNKAPSDFLFQSWDGSGWVNIFSETGNTNPVYDIGFSPVITSKVRLYGTAATDSYFRLYEIAVYGDNSPFGLWVGDYTLGGPSALWAADPDTDGYNNLGEYAFGGDPTNGAYLGHVPSATVVVSGGTNYFDYVYARRNDAESRGLAYSLEATTNLVSVPWTNSSAEVTGVGLLDTEFDSVTNRISGEDDDQKYLRLRVEYCTSF